MTNEVGLPDSSKPEAAVHMGGSIMPERFNSTSAPAFREEYLNEWAGPKQCEAHALGSTARCSNAAEYALIVGDLTGYVCGECLGSQVRANAQRRPVTVEKLQ